MKKRICILILIILAIAIFYGGMLYREARPKAASIKYKIDNPAVQKKIEDFVKKIGNYKDYANCDYLTISATEIITTGNDPNCENNVTCETSLCIQLLRNDFHADNNYGVLVECCPIAGKRVLIKKYYEACTVIRKHPYAGEYYRYTLPDEYEKYLEIVKLWEQGIFCPRTLSDWAVLRITLRRGEIVACIITSYMEPGEKYCREIDFMD